MLSHNAWAKSDIGKRRANNEDSYFIDDKIALFMVADGMGGHRGGKRASSLAIESAAFSYKEQLAKGLSPNLALEYAMDAAAKSVYEAGHREENNLGMGTTLSILAISGDVAHIAHIGDTRIYCLRGESFKQLTRDHSLVNEQVQAGIITQDEARISPFRNIITRALGQKTKINADYFSIKIEDKDIFLLCSDGLTTMVKDEVINEIINGKNSVFASVENLIDEANISGGDDNITAIIINLSLLT